MIKMVNLTKDYRSKKGTVTRALRNISLTFDSKGITFILGKSGSGKSTLLNILGGLDKYDSGDLLILGKSTKNFTSSDFDSYRNTYVGFVFQEFNLLEDYNVYENIVLALQLQKKEIKNDEINYLLEKLELKELKYRKINELSGGQKQRVAIARALIKNPKIILADEPTGNLDSETGKQVIKLLKKISQDKLVIVVSHDEELAKKYSDRIIEIRDGSIISDTRKIQHSYNSSSNYQIIRSSLPFSDSFKIAMGSLKYKKLRMFLTIILIVFSILFLSISDSLSSYNLNLAHSKLLIDKNEKFVQIERYSLSEDEGYLNKQLKPLYENDIKEIQNTIIQKVNPIYRLKNHFGYFTINDLFHLSNKNNENIGIEIVSDNDAKYLSRVNLIGNIPSDFNEIVISNYVADLMMKNGIVMDDYGDLYYPKSYQDILENNNFSFGEKMKVKIVGIIDYEINKYLELEKNSQIDPFLLSDDDYNNLNEYNKKKKNIYNKIFVTDEFINYLNLNSNFLLDTDYSFQLISTDIKFCEDLAIYLPTTIDGREIEYYDGKEWRAISSLKENEVILNIHQLKEFNEDDYKTKLTNYINNNLGKKQLEVEKQFFKDYMSNYRVIDKNVDLTISNLYNDDVNKKYRNLKVIGITGLITTGDNDFYISSSIFSEYKMNPVLLTGAFILENNQKELKKVMDKFKFQEELSLKSTYSDDVSEVMRTVKILKKIAFYVSMVFALFTVLLTFNFMSSNINYCKKTIGILRGLGARCWDVVKIFLWETIILSSISFIISSIGLVFLTNLMNLEILNSGINLILTPFIITARQFIVIFIFSYLLILVSSIIPIIKICKKKPVDIMYNK